MHTHSLYAYILQELELSNYFGFKIIAHVWKKRMYPTSYGFFFYYYYPDHYSTTTSSITSIWIEMQEIKPFLLVEYTVADAVPRRPRQV